MVRRLFYQPLRTTITRIELWMLVAQHLDSIHAVYDLFIATHLDFLR